MSLSKHFLRAIVFAVCALFFVSAAHAQYRASVQGVVTDSQGVGYVDQQFLDTLPPSP